LTGAAELNYEKYIANKVGRIALFMPQSRCTMFEVRKNMEWEWRQVWRKRSGG